MPSALRLEIERDHVDLERHDRRGEDDGEEHVERTVAELGENIAGDRRGREDRRAVDRTAEAGSCCRSSAAAACRASTALKLASVGSSGMTVGGQVSISCGVLKALETRRTSGRSISRQTAVSNTSITTLTKRAFVRADMPRLARVFRVSGLLIGGSFVAQQAELDAGQHQHDRQQHHRLGRGIADAVVAEAVLQHVEHQHAHLPARRALGVGGQHEGLGIDVEAGHQRHDRNIERDRLQQRHRQMPESSGRPRRHRAWPPRRARPAGS